MATNKDVDRIEHSNIFQNFLNSFMTSDNTGLSTFLANQIKDDGINVSSGAKGKGKDGKKGKGKRKQMRGKVNNINNKVVYVPAIHNGTDEVGIVLGSTDPTETSVYKNLLRNDLLKELDETFSKMLLENKIPIINSGKILTYIDVVSNELNNGEINNGEVNNELTNGEGSEIDNGGKGKNMKQNKHHKNIEQLEMANNETLDLENGAKGKRGSVKKVKPVK